MKVVSAIKKLLKERAEHDPGKTKMRVFFAQDWHPRITGHST